MTTIFIKSCQKDFKFLYYCLYSIKKFCYGTFDVVLVIDKGDVLTEEIKALDNFKCYEVSKVGNGYLFQQFVKMTAYEYTDSENILFVDSDCVFKKPVNIDEIVANYIHYYTPYDKAGDAIVWKSATELILEQQVDYEFMRRLPIYYKRDTLIDCTRLFKRDMLQSILTTNNFSEFNVLGAYAYYFESDKYTFRNTEDNQITDDYLYQAWTWGNEEQTKQYINEYKKVLDIQ